MRLQMAAADVLSSVSRPLDAELPSIISIPTLLLFLSFLFVGKDISYFYFVK